MNNKSNFNTIKYPTVMKANQVHPDGIPVNRFNETVDDLRMYRILAFLAMVANVALAFLGFMYI
jgi:hypothetical protein